MIEIWTEELPPSWRWHPQRFCGGTIEFVVETAKVLSEVDDVMVYYDGQACNDGRVYYLPREEFEGTDIVLSCNSHAPKRGRYALYWNTWYKARREQCHGYNEHIVLSPYHHSLFGRDSRIVPLSCWPQNYKDPAKVKGRCLFASSPDRGEDFLNSIWPDVQKETGAELISVYDPDLPKDELDELYKSSEFWLHPGQGIELFCISAVKAQVAQCIPVVVPNMALSTTVRYGVRTTLEKYKDDLIDAIKNPPQVCKVDFGSWETVTHELFKNTEVFKGALV